MHSPTNPQPIESNKETTLPGPQSFEAWKQEQEVIGPGLQTAVQWSQLAFRTGSGSFITDVDDNVYIDFMGASGVNSIGHSHPRFVKALSKQLSSLVISSFVSQARLDMLETLRKVFPVGLDRIQLYSSGTEAVEAALRLAKSYTQKFEFLGFWNAFHGKTMGSLALTDGARRGLGPVAPGFYSVPFAYCYRCPFRLKFPSCGFACVEHVREVIRHQTAGTLAGIVVEPVQGRAGNIPPPPGYLQAIFSVAQEFNALLIADESITGFGRTGEMFASQYDEVIPDIMIVGKGMGGGFPVTGVISKTSIMKAAPYSDPSASSSSFGGFPMACCAADTTVQVIVEENLVQRSKNLGLELLKMLKRTEREVPIIGEVRGKGLMMGIELVEDKKSKRPLSKEALRQVYLALLKQGLLVMVGANSIRLYPPLSTEPEIARRAINIIDNVLRQQSQVFNKN